MQTAIRVIMSVSRGARVQVFIFTTTATTTTHGAGCYQCAHVRLSSPSLSLSLYRLLYSHLHSLCTHWANKCWLIWQSQSYYDCCYFCFFLFAVRRLLLIEHLSDSFWWLQELKSGKRRWIARAFAVNALHRPLLLLLAWLKAAVTVVKERVAISTEFIL